jgi:hypothetical protein
MRVLHLDSGKELRGGQIQVLRLIEGLTSRGVECTLLARPGFPLFRTARQKGFHVEALGLARAVIAARQHDLVHAHDARSHTLAALLRAGPLVVSRRVAFPIGTSKTSQWKYGRATHYLAVSEFVRSVLVAGGVPAEKISVVPDGVPVLDQASGADVIGLQKENTLAEEAARLAGIPIRLTSDLERDLASASVLVYITFSEGLGSGVLLAMSAGVAVVASRIGGLPEVIEHGRNGLLVENTPQSIADGMREVNVDREFARRLGEAARATVREGFTVDRMVERTMETYRKVLA